MPPEIVLKVLTGSTANRNTARSAGGKAALAQPACIADIHGGSLGQRITCLPPQFSPVL